MDVDADRELPLAEAADELGLTSEALRMRWRRGKARGRRDDAGKVWIVLGPNKPEQPTGRRPNADRSKPEQSNELVEVLKGQVSDLQKRLDAAEQAQSEMRRLLLSSQQQLAEMTKRLPELPAPEAVRAAPEPAPQSDPAPGFSPPPKPAPAAERAPFNPLSIFFPWVR